MHAKQDVPFNNQPLPPVILSVVGAHATTKSKDPEDAGGNDAATGSFLETKDRHLNTFCPVNPGKIPWTGMVEDAFSGSFRSSSRLSSLGFGQDDRV